MLKMTLAGMDDFGRIEKLYGDCIADLNKKGIHQWDERYPNTATITDGIHSGCQYLFEEEHALIGSIILNQIQSEQWNSMPWKYALGKVLIMHTLAIDPAVQGKGYGQSALDACIAFGVDNGYAAMRLDVFSENPAAIRLYEKNGFERVGEVIFPFKPEGHQVYRCYERTLKR